MMNSHTSIHKDWIEEPQPEDVMSGRGAAVNTHMGNRQFRALCFARKAEFDAGNHSLKRRIATEIVAATPGRFLKRPKNYNAPKTNNNTNTNTNSHHQYWMVLTHETSILKACQVMRDFQRPDRVALREMAALERLQKTSQRQQRAHLDDHEHEHEPPPTHVVLPQGDSTTTIPTDTTQQVLVEGNTGTISASVENTTTVDDADMKETMVGNNDGNNGDDDGTTIVVREHDVLSGRGAFVNAHAGNQEFRRMAMVRKPAFDAGNFTDKRALAMEIVSTIQERGGRFLQRAKQQPQPSHHQSQSQQPLLMGTTTWRLPPRGKQGTWEALTDEKAIHKACQVMRDFQRPDRLHDRESESNPGLIIPVQLPSPPPAPLLSSNPHPNLPVPALPPPPTTTASTILTTTTPTIEPLEQSNDSVVMEEDPVVTVLTTGLDPSLNGVSVTEELGEGGNDVTVGSSESAAHV